MQCLNYCHLFVQLSLDLFVHVLVQIFVRRRDDGNGGVEQKSSRLEARKL